MTSGAIRAATDVGGTFTDLVYFSTDPLTGLQEIVTAKSDTTPPDFEQGVMNVLRKSGVSLEEIAFLAHGTTLVINALTERKGVRTGLITTEGFRDSLEIARGNRPDFFNLHYEKPPPFVPRYLRREVPGRLSPVGRERAPLDLSGLSAILDDFRAEGVEAVAICLLHSYADPSHEQAVLERVQRALAGGLGRRLASDQPRVARVRADEHSGALGVRAAGRRALSERGSRTASTRPAVTASSTSCSRTAASTRSRRRSRSRSRWSSQGRPAASGGRRSSAERSVTPNVLALDIGGTTAKCSLIEGGARKDHLRLLDRARPAARPATRSRCRSSTSSRSATAAAASRGSTTSAGCTWGRSRRARCRARRRTAAAGPRPRRPTPISRSAGSIPDYFCGGEIEADMDAVRPHARRDRARSSASIPPRRRAASSGSRTTT